METIVPENLCKDKYWKPILYLFKNHYRLSQCFNKKYFDLENGEIKISSLKRASAPWSNTEKFMLSLALHLYNERHKVNLSDMDYLDQTNLKLAFEAMEMRFS
ncbi:hypothetical protein [Metabacillus fastidiosus]|uniref:hypothetical protein n=1 Tax=Metabacillus fastidiosus TaxID=1458 RepID=UPI003D278410